jgi:hypothetical protein
MVGCAHYPATCENKSSRCESRPVTKPRGPPRTPAFAKTPAGPYVFVWKMNPLLLPAPPAPPAKPITDKCQMFYVSAEPVTDKCRSHSPTVQFGYFFLFAYNKTWSCNWCMARIVTELRHHPRTTKIATTITNNPLVHQGATSADLRNVQKTNNCASLGPTHLVRGFRQATLEAIREKELGPHF